MSKADQKALKQQAKNTIASTNQQSQQISGQLNDVLGESRSNASAMLPGITSGYSDIQSSGGYDPSVLGDVRSTYTNLARTGGIDENAATAMRNRAQRSAQGVYEDVGRTAQRAASATGGYGYSGAIAGDLARKGSEAAERASTSSNADIAKLRQTGMEAGAAGLSDTENKLAGNRLTALQGQSNVYGLNLNEVNNTVDGIIKNFQANGQITAQEQQILANLANQPGIFDKIMSTIGTLGGAAAGVMGGVGALGGVAGAAGRSDIRVKKNIEFLGWKNKIPLVTFEFIDEPGIKIGTIAQDVQKVYPDLVYEFDNILHVDYAKLGERLCQ